MDSMYFMFYFHFRRSEQVIFTVLEKHSVKSGYSHLWTGKTIICKEDICDIFKVLLRTKGCPIQVDPSEWKLLDKLILAGIHHIYGLLYNVTCKGTIDSSRDVASSKK